MVGDSARLFMGPLARMRHEPMQTSEKTGYDYAGQANAECRRLEPHQYPGMQTDRLRAGSGQRTHRGATA